MWSSGSGSRGDAGHLVDLARRTRQIVERSGRLRLLVQLERIGLREALSLGSRLESFPDLSPHVERVAVAGRVHVFPSGDLEVARA